MVSGVFILVNEMNDRKLLELAARAAGMVCYNQETGSMTWRKKSEQVSDAKRWNSRYAGKECGTIDDKGYRRILFRFGKGPTFKIRAHRLAWFIVYGSMPELEIDHINQCKTDNSIANLRDVKRTVNQRNGTRKGNNTSGVPGVSWHKQRGKWCAQANFDGKHYHIGLFDDLTAAADAARQFRSENGFTNNHGRVVK